MFPLGCWTRMFGRKWKLGIRGCRCLAMPSIHLGVGLPGGAYEHIELQMIDATANTTMSGLN